MRPIHGLQHAREERLLFIYSNGRDKLSEDLLLHPLDVLDKSAGRPAFSKSCAVSINAAGGMRSALRAASMWPRLD